MRDDMTTARIYRADLELAEAVRTMMMQKAEAFMKQKADIAAPPVRASLADIIHAGMDLLHSATVTGEILAFPVADFKKRIRETFVIPAVIDSLAKFGIKARATRQPDGVAYLMVEHSDQDGAEFPMEFPMEEEQATVMN